MVKTLTARFIESVKPTAGRSEYRDDQVIGLMLRVAPGGAKTWSVQFVRKTDGRKRRVTIGTFPAFSLDDARTEARTIVARISRGEDPTADRKPRAEYFTFGKLADIWLERYARPGKVASAVYDDTLLLNKDILPAIGAMKVEEVAKRDVILLADAMLARGAKTRCNRAIALVRSIYRWGIAEDLVALDPTLGIKPRTVERPRERVLSEAEIEIVWKELDTAPMTRGLQLAIKLALVTGQRIGMVEGMAKTELDLTLTNPIWTVPGSRTKNRELTRVPLSPLAIRLIAEAIAIAGDSVYVFPSPVGQGPITGHAATRAMSRTRTHLTVPDFRIHDLRRTCASGMAMLGINPHTIALVLDHISTTKASVTSSVYVKYSFDKEKRHALETWAAYLERVTAASSLSRLESGDLPFENVTTISST